MRSGARTCYIRRMETEETPQSLQPCAYTGAMLPVSQMVQLSGHWIDAAQKDACVQFLQQGGVLPVIHGDKMPIPPPRLVPVWREAWRIFRLAFPAMLLMHTIVWLPGDLLSSYMDMEVFSEDDIGHSVQFASR